MVEVKDGEFVEIEYTGRIKSNNLVFDTTDEKIAKEERIHRPNAKYGSRVICIGQGHVIKGLDDQLKGTEIGKEYTFEIDMKNAFGKKDSKLMRTVSMSIFKKQDMNPFPGLQINADGRIGTVRSVTGGRVVVDFNHPLAGRDLIYFVKLIKKIEDKKKQVESLLEIELGLNDGIYSVIEDSGDIEIRTKIKIPDELQKKFAERLKTLVTGLKKLKITEEEKK